MEDTSLTRPGPGMCGCDREVFERVWRRVMPADRPDCPFTLYGEEGAAPMAEPAPAEPPVSTEPPAPACGGKGRVDPLSPEEDVPCLGAASAVYGPLLQEFITHERNDEQTYRLLARRVGGGAGRTLAAMATDEARHARRLGAAYFLISGVRFRPEGAACLPPEGTYFSALRDRFLAEQRGAGIYRTAAGRTDDPCLKELFTELAEDETAHARLLRGLLEQA